MSSGVIKSTRIGVDVKIETLCKFGTTFSVDDILADFVRTDLCQIDVSHQMNIGRNDVNELEI